MTQPSSPAPAPARSDRPRLSVVVRSYNRVPALCELLAILLDQDHDSFEVVVVEQSTTVPPEAAAALTALEVDPRLRVLRSGPLGGARARNVGVAAVRGEVVVFIDDDDLPIGRDFLRRIEERFADPRCMGLTVRHFWEQGTDEKVGPLFRRFARRRCMKFSWLLRLPHTYARHDEPFDGCDYVHGTGGAYRRSVFARFGGWDEDTPIEDEASLGIRISRGLTGGEYLCFHPAARLQRRMDLGGGLAKRKAGAPGYFRRFMTFIHHILGRYHRTRVVALYPCYVMAAWYMTLEWIWGESNDHPTTWSRLLGSAKFTVTVPYHAAKALFSISFGRPPGSGVALAATLAPAPEAER